MRKARELSELNRTLELRVAEQVAQIERLGRLKRFFSPQLAELIAAGGAEDPLRSHRREITVVFLDLRGFIAFAETAEPEELMSLLAEYHREMGRLILAHEGTLEPLGIGIGIAQGYATLGAIGFEGRVDYGAIGAVTNLAARLCAEAPAGQVLVSQRVAAAIEGPVPMEAVGPLSLKGFARPVQAFTLGEAS